MAEHARVVVIGGGVVGCSCLYHLAKIGITDALLIERDELTSGSTWHAAGNLPTFSTSWSIMKLQKYSAALYRELAASSEDPINYHITGSVRLAHNRNRMDEFHHVQSMGRANGLEYDILSPTELKERYPFIETHDLLGALWDPLDGDIDPSQLTQALARGARALGARVQRHTRVTSLAQRPDGEWLVGTDKGEVVAEIVVNAAGYRAGEIMAMLGRHLPIAVMSHQYLVTEDVPELQQRSERLPLLRDPDTSYYLRQERHGFILGPYEWKATPMWLDGLPDDFANQLWNDDFERIEHYIDDAMARVPLLAKAGIKRGVNGPIPYSPDGNPYIGPEPGLRNFFHCNNFSFGITQGGGAGKALAEWVLHGQTEWDLWSLDRRRYTEYASTAYTVAKAIEVYQNEYASSFPYEEREAGRPLRTSPLYQRLKAKGARFGARGGWERATYFDLGGTMAPDQPSFRREHVWFDVVAQEVRAVRERVAVMDFLGFTKFELQGPGALAHLDRLSCSKLPAIGRVSLAYALTPNGKLLSEFTLTRLAEDKFQIICASTAATHDRDLLQSGLPEDGSVTLHDRSNDSGTLIVVGPRARELLAQVTDADLSNAAFPWLSARTITTVAGDMLALRVNYVGELGWELHAPLAAMPALYDAIWRAGEPLGIRDFGMYAMDSLRVDKCYRGWKSDLESGYTPLEASLDRFVAADKPADFVGKQALQAELARGPAQRFVPLIFDAPGDAEAPYCAQVFDGDTSVGLATSGVWSHTLDKSVALAYVRSAQAKPGTRLLVDVLGHMRPATVQQEPMYDPRNERLRV
ncbi:MAG: FAD-dependent oxidoreductase [Betaproteobacteria bacterium]